MSLQELIREIATNCDACESADKEGRPVEARERLVAIKDMVAAFLGEPEAVDEKPTFTDEQPRTIEQGEPVPAKEESVNNEEQRLKPGHCQPDEVHEDSGDPKEKQEDLR